VTPAKRQEMFRRLREANPHPRSELAHSNPFELLIAVILSAQATDKSVNLVTPALFERAPNARAMLELGVAGLTPFIKSIGLFNSKAKNIIEACRILVGRHGGDVPKDRAALEELPGVGRKTANVVLNVAFGEPTIAVDTHVFRVANRTGLAHGTTPEQIEAGLLKVVPEEFRHHAHHWLILHGRYVCKARRPVCPGCVIRDLCAFDLKTPPVEETGGKARLPRRTAGAGSRPRPVRTAPARGRRASR
jgi:endonuclease-3